MVVVGEVSPNPSPNPNPDPSPFRYVTYNGDWFDWPFIAKRSKVHGMSIYRELGMKWDEKANEVRSRFSLHLDALCWVNRDSYLPQGSRGLKMVTKYKLGYDPLEVHPEDMVRLCWEDPKKMVRNPNPSPDPGETRSIR